MRVAVLIVRAWPQFHLNGRVLNVEAFFQQPLNVANHLLDVGTFWNQGVQR